MKMRIGRETIVEMFRRRGQHDRAEEVALALPDEVDTRADVELLGRCGIDPREMVNRIPPETPRTARP